MTFAKRKIDLTFKLAKANGGAASTFTEGNFDTLKVSGLRVVAQIQSAMSPAKGETVVQVWGLSWSLMNQLAVVNRSVDGAIQFRYNQLIVEAGDEGGALSTVFSGQINTSEIVTHGAPEVYLTVSGYGGLYEAIRPVPPISFPGAADAVVILRDLAEQNGYAFENNGVPATMLHSPYFPGTAYDQMRACAQHANINLALDSGILAIWPRGGSRHTPVPVVISPDTGMIGYPNRDTVGVHVRTLFNPNLMIGRPFKIEGSSMGVANGVYSCYGASHYLSSELPDGPWETFVAGAPLGGAQVIGL